MAAILPHLAEEDETTELQERYWDCSAEGLAGPDVLCPSPQAVIDQSHAELLNVAYLRRIVVEQLQGRTITPFLRGKEVALKIDQPIEGPRWHPTTGVGTTALLSWTSKMGAPSFSLPAGAAPMGGSCPGANAGQSIVPDPVRRKAAKVLLNVLKEPQVELAKSICEFCYAEGGQYASANVQYHQMVRYAWVRRALQVDLHGNRTQDVRNSEFVSLMIEAIDRVDFKLGEEPEHFRGKRFFRLHDSGDFYSLAYLDAWKVVANHYHPDNNDNPIVFWAPTRIWAIGDKVVQHVNRINGDGRSNLVIRPSAYHINQHGPEGLGPGWTMPSTVYAKDAKPGAYDWDCKAYLVEKGPTCRGAENPDGDEGCRACWLHDDKRVNYTLH
jgi:hypothetical protein